MHKRNQMDWQLVRFDPEIETTRRRQRGARKKQQAQIIMVERDARVLRDYVLPQATDITSLIVNPAVEANNVELRPAFVSFVKKD